MLWFVLVVLVGSGVAVWLIRNPKRLANQFATNMRLPLPPERVEEVGRRVGLYQTVALATTVLLFAVGLELLNIRWRHTAHDTEAGLLIGAAFGIQGLYISGGYPIAYLIDRRRQASSGTVTHPVPPRTADFLPPWLTWLARAVAVLPLASWLVLSDRFWSGGLLSVAPIAVVAATEWAQLRIASGPHRAATGLDLAYDDGFRSLAIVSLAGLPAVAALVAASGISYHTRSELGLQVVMVALVAATVFRILTLVPGMSRRFRHRLSAVS